MNHHALATAAVHAHGLGVIGIIISVIVVGFWAVLASAPFWATEH